MITNFLVAMIKKINSSTLSGSDWISHLISGKTQFQLDSKKCNLVHHEQSFLNIMCIKLETSFLNICLDCTFLAREGNNMQAYMSAVSFPQQVIHIQTQQKLFNDSNKCSTYISSHVDAKIKQH